MKENPFLGKWARGRFITLITPGLQCAFAYKNDGILASDTLWTQKTSRKLSSYKYKTKQTTPDTVKFALGM